VGGGGGGLKPPCPPISQPLCMCSVVVYLSTDTIINCILVTADLELINNNDYKKCRIAKGCGLLEFFNKKHIEFSRGCTFYEFKNETEDIHRNSRIILIDKVGYEYHNYSIIISMYTMSIEYW
jgi:hypothetical protein